jgi:hypothetical protein
MPGLRCCFIFTLIELWGGFETDGYSAFNPAYRIEVLRSDMEGIVEKVFVRRFQSKDFTQARCLFFLKDNEDQLNYTEFLSIMRKVNAVCPEVRNKLDVRVRKDERAKDYPEFYVGKQCGKDTCIIEPAPSDSVLTEERGKRGNPKFYLVTNDTDICKEYRNWFDREFDPRKARS